MFSLTNKYLITYLEWSRVLETGFLAFVFNQENVLITFKLMLRR